MRMQYSGALVGDYNSSVPARQAIPLALGVAADYHGVPIHGTWVPTASIQDAEAQFKSYQGIWCVPASPYQNTQGALSAIRFAREQKLPFLGTCGGFQHALLEYARNALGMQNASHAETDPGGGLMFVTRLSCPLVDQTRLITINSEAFKRIYGADAGLEGFNCSYCLNPE